MRLQVAVPTGGSGEDQGAGWVMTSSQTVNGSPQAGRCASGRPVIARRLVAQVRAVALGSLTLLGLGFPWCAAGSEQAMQPGDGLSAVQVTTDKSSYGLGEPIVVTIVNSLSVPIYALSGQTYCTIVTVQRSEDGRWSTERRCLAFAPPGWTEIVPGRRTPVEVKSGLAFDRPLAPGRHRVLFTFNIGSPGGSSATVFSSEFLISDASRVPSITARTSGSHRQIG